MGLRASLRFEGFQILESGDVYFLKIFSFFDFHQERTKICIFGSSEPKSVLLQYHLITTLKLFQLRAF